MRCACANSKVVVQFPGSLTLFLMPPPPCSLPSLTLSCKLILLLESFLFSVVLLEFISLWPFVFPSLVQLVNLTCLLCQLFLWFLDLDLSHQFTELDEMGFHSVLFLCACFVSLSFSFVMIITWSCAPFLFALSACLTGSSLLQEKKVPSCVSKKAAPPHM